MTIIRITLFDYDFQNDQPVPPLHAEMRLQSDMTLEEQGGKKLAIFCGDDVAGGTVMLPLFALDRLMSQLMSNDTLRKSSLFMPKKPGIIKPN